MSLEKFPGTGAMEWSNAGLGDEFPPADCPVKGDPTACCTYKFTVPPCRSAVRAIRATHPLPWWRRLLRWGR